MSIIRYYEWILFIIKIRQYACILSQFDYYGEVTGHGQGGSKYVYSKILCSIMVL